MHNHRSTNPLVEGSGEAGLLVTKQRARPLKVIVGFLCPAATHMQKGVEVAMKQRGALVNKPGHKSKPSEPEPNAK
eukprot:12883916-Prorocentrum_lima.AAC.1